MNYRMTTNSLLMISTQRMNEREQTKEGIPQATVVQEEQQRKNHLLIKISVKE